MDWVGRDLQECFVNESLSVCVGCVLCQTSTAVPEGKESKDGPGDNLAKAEAKASTSCSLNEPQNSSGQAKKTPSKRNLISGLIILFSQIHEFLLKRTSNPIFIGDGGI